MSIQGDAIHHQSSLGIDQHTISKKAKMSDTVRALFQTANPADYLEASLIKSGKSAGIFFHNFFKEIEAKEKYSLSNKSRLLAQLHRKFSVSQPVWDTLIQTSITKAPHCFVSLILGLDKDEALAFTQKTLAEKEHEFDYDTLIVLIDTLRGNSNYIKLVHSLWGRLPNGMQRILADGWEKYFEELSTYHVTIVLSIYENLSLFLDYFRGDWSLYTLSYQECLTAAESCSEKIQITQKFFGNELMYDHDLYTELIKEAIYEEGYFKVYLLLEIANEPIFELLSREDYQQFLKNLGNISNKELQEIFNSYPSAIIDKIPLILCFPLGDSFESLTLNELFHQTGLFRVEEAEEGIGVPLSLFEETFKMIPPPLLSMAFRKSNYRRGIVAISNFLNEIQTQSLLVAISPDQILTTLESFKEDMMTDVFRRIYCSMSKEQRDALFHDYLPRVRKEHQLFQTQRTSLEREAVSILKFSQSAKRRHDEQAILLRFRKLEDDVSCLNSRSRVFFIQRLNREFFNLFPLRTAEIKDAIQIEQRLIQGDPESLHRRLNDLREMLTAQGTSLERPDFEEEELSNPFLEILDIQTVRLIGIPSGAEFTKYGLKSDRDFLTLGIDPSKDRLIKEIESKVKDALRNAYERHEPVSTDILKRLQRIDGSVNAALRDFYAYAPQKGLETRVAQLSSIFSILPLAQQDEYLEILRRLLSTVPMKSKDQLRLELGQFSTLSKNEAWKRVIRILFKNSSITLLSHYVHQENAVGAWRRIKLKGDIHSLAKLYQTHLEGSSFSILNLHELSESLFGSPAKKYRRGGDL